MGFIIIVISIILLFIVIGIVNKVNKYKVKIEEAYSSIEIALVKRYDIINQSFECAKGYAKHEKELFSQLIEVRRGMSVSQLQDAAYSQNNAIKSLWATVEAYPNLKADNLFSNIQDQLTVENEHYAAAKRVYNSNVSIYNQYIVTFPVCLVALLIGSHKKDFFKEENIESKKDFSIKF